MHGTVYANNAVNEADLLLAVGVRFDDRVTGKIEKFAEHGTIVHIDIDNSEINKNKVVRLPILSDVKYALTRLNQLLGTVRQKAGRSQPRQVHGLVHEDRRVEARASPSASRTRKSVIQPQYVIRLLMR